MCLLSLKAARVVVVSVCLERRVAFTPGLVYLTVCVHVCGVQRGFVPLALTDSLIYLNPLLRACILLDSFALFPSLVCYGVLEAFVVSFPLSFSFSPS